MRKSELSKIKLITFCVVIASHICNKYSDDNRSNLSVKQKSFSVFQLHYELIFCSIFCVFSQLYEGREYFEHFDLLSFSAFLHTLKRFNGVKTPGSIRNGTCFIRKDPRKAKIEKKKPTKHIIHYNYYFLILILRDMSL